MKEPNRVRKNEVIGYWETMHEAWEKSNGQIGKRYDQHLSPDANKSLAEYLLPLIPTLFVKKI